MDIKKRTLTTLEESVLKNDLPDVQDWVDNAIAGKINNCKKRMIREWLPKLYADDSVTQIPANEDEMIALVVARDDYKSCEDRESPAEESPSEPEESEEEESEE